MAEPQKQPQKGVPLPQGQKYPDLPPDSELFESESDKQQLMADFGLSEEQARTVRSLNLV